MNTSTSGLSPDVAALTDAVKALLLKNTTPPPASVKAFEESCVTCGGPHPYYQCPATNGNAFPGYHDNIQAYVSAAAENYNQGNTGHRPLSVGHQVRPPGFPPVHNNQNQGNNYNPGNSTYRAPIPPTQAAPCSMKAELKNKFQATMLQQNNKLENMLSNYFQMNKPPSSGPLPSNTVTNPKGDLKAITSRSGVSYDGPPIPPLFSSSPKVVEREPEVTKDPVQSSTEKVQPLDVQPQAPTFEPVNAPKPVDLCTSGIAEDVFVKVGKFHFLADFVVVDYVVDPRVPLILERPFLRTARTLIDVYGEELTLRVDDEAITFKVGQTSRYSYNNAKLVNRIDVMTFHILSFLLLSLLALLLKESLILLEKLLNDDPSSLLPPKELNFEELKTIKYSIDDPPELELKDLPSHLEYAFLEGTDKLPVIISKELKDEENATLVKVLKSNKRAIAWRISDIKGINPRFCTHKILMEDDFKPAVQHQRRVNPKIHEVIKKEVIKLLDAGLIYPISDSPWVSPVQCVPKKGGITVVENEDNELILTRLVTGWRVCIDYRKLNDATRKDHFPLPFMGQML
ncbi:reverse transcriptase domain-containing protein [Tanacetum coccineum]|uniref:Reverse transcriptase domain-containing protein n=1 Tax=Tanacetum coccineum TaxID=301880 RepID=A0ABQ5CTW4_9ASTR